MAPEGWEGNPNTPKLDVYSVGLVFYEILCLRHPLVESVADVEDWKDWRKAHLFASIPDVRSSRSEVSLSLSQLLQRMIAKRPSDRPEWDEILTILASTEQTPPKPSTLTAAVEAAIKLRHEQEKMQLASQEAKERARRTIELYEYSCKQLLALFDRVIRDFNAQYQHGQIEIEEPRELERSYNFPTGGSIRCDFFPMRETGISLRGRQLIGGGWLGIANGPSTNLLLLRENAQDLYGQWIGCFVKISAFVDAKRQVGKRGIRPDTVEPFGFRSPQDFYEEMRNVGSMHIFTYDLRYDMEEVFTGLLQTVFNPPPRGMAMPR